MPRNTTLRPDQRLWNNRNVDINLKDEWLVDLNKLRCFDLISICEGHITNNPNQPRNFSHITLKLKVKFIDFFANKWIENSNKIIKIISNNQVQDTIPQYELTRKLSILQKSNTDKIVVKFNSRIHRTTIEMDSETVKWFETAIAKINIIDKSFLKLFTNI